MVSEVMRIANISKYQTGTVTLLDTKNSLNFKDVTKERSVFISDSIPFTYLSKLCSNSLWFSDKFTRNIFIKKNVKIGSLSIIRSTAALNTLLLKNHLQFTPIEYANLYDLTLETSTIHKQFQGLNRIKRIELLLAKDEFLNEKDSFNLFYFMDPLAADLKPVLGADLISKTQAYKTYPFSPSNNEKISRIFILIPYVDNKSHKIMFACMKVFDRSINKNFIDATFMNEYKRLSSALHKVGTPISKDTKPVDEKTDEVHVEVAHAKKSKENKNEINNNSQVSTEEEHHDRATKNHNFYVEQDKTIVPEELAAKEEKEEHNQKINLKQDNQASYKKIDDLEVDKSVTYFKPADKLKDKNQITEYTNGKLLDDYMKKAYDKDVFNCSNGAIQSFCPNLEVTDVHYEDSSDAITEAETLIFKIRDREKGGEPYDVKLKIPKLIENKFFKLYGKKYTLSNQVYSNLISKIKEDLVAFTSVYNKTMIYIQGTVDDKIGKILLKNTNLSSMPKTKHEYISNENKDIPNSLHAVFKFVPIFEYEDYYISYDIYRKCNLLNSRDVIIGCKSELYEEFIKDHTNPSDFIAKHGKKSVLMYNKDNDTINGKAFLLSMKHYLEKTEASASKIRIPQSSQYARMNIAGKKIPVIYAMMIYLLNKTNETVSISELFNRYFPQLFCVCVEEKPKDDNIIPIKLADGYFAIHVKENFVCAELLLSPLRKIDLSKYTIEDLQRNGSIFLILNAYFMSQKLDTKVTIKSIGNILNCMVDPITESLLKEANYTYKSNDKDVVVDDIIEILYYCVSLLNDRTYKAGNDFSSYRVRNMETIPAIIYKVFSEAAAEYSANIKSKKITKSKRMPLHETAVFDVFRQLPVFESYSDLNVSSEMGALSKATYKGFGGINNNRSVSYELRSVDPSIIGFIDPGNNVDNMNVGSNRMLPLNPNIKDIRGSKPADINLRSKVMDNKKLTDEETSSLLSFDTYNEPFLATSSDAPRINMCSIQARHGIPLHCYDDLPIKTGAEDIIKNNASSSFVIRSICDGTVKSIDEKKKIITITSKDNKHDHKISYKEKVANNSGGGFSHLKTFEPSIKVGQKVSKDEAIALDKGTFKNGNYTNAKLLLTSFLGFAETYEDSAFIAESVAKEIVFDYVTEKVIYIKKNQVILSCIKDIGTKVGVDEPILTFSRADEEPEKETIFNIINQTLDDSALRSYVKSKYPGEIVDIKVEYCSEHPRQMPELLELIKKLPKENVISSASKDTKWHYDMDSVKITYYIMSKIPALSGSKATNQSTKSVFIVKPDDQMPRTLDGKMIEFVTSSFSILTRMTINNYKNLYLNKCIMKLREVLKEELKK